MHLLPHQVHACVWMHTLALPSLRESLSQEDTVLGPSAALLLRSHLFEAYFVPMCIVATSRDLSCLHIHIVEDSTVVGLCPSASGSENYSQRCDQLPSSSQGVAIWDARTARRQNPHGAQGRILWEKLLQLLRIVHPGLQDPIPSIACILQEVDSHATLTIFVLRHPMCTQLLAQLLKLPQAHTWTAATPFSAAFTKKSHLLSMS